MNQDGATAAPMHEQLRQDAEGAILFDPSVSPQVDGRWFDPAYWQDQGALNTLTGGRGGVAVIVTPAGECVLRHYRRGGMVAKLMGDRYLWTGAERTRGFAEFRLLQAMHGLGLPAPHVVAARYQRLGVHYRADLIMRRIPDTQTLAACLADGRLDAELAQEVGALVARFHRAGVWHADLNAHNVLVASSALYMIDFDRGCMREPGEGWRMANLQRLRRSLFKLGAAPEGEAAFDRNIWTSLMYGYERTLSA
jgi:3-deoxy-D-manno-octulosonic acid kinase